MGCLQNGHFLVTCGFDEQVWQTKWPHGTNACIVDCSLHTPHSISMFPRSRRAVHSSSVKRLQDDGLPTCSAEWQENRAGESEVVWSSAEAVRARLGAGTSPANQLQLRQLFIRTMSTVVKPNSVQNSLFKEVQAKGTSSTVNSNFSSCAQNLA